MGVKAGMLSLVLVTLSFSMPSPDNIMIFFFIFAHFVELLDIVMPCSRIFAHFVELLDIVMLCSRISAHFVELLDIVMPF